MSDNRSGMLTRVEIVMLAESLQALLGDDATGLSSARRARLEGALTALEIVLGQPATLIDAELAASIRELL